LALLHLDPTFQIRFLQISRFSERSGFRFHGLLQKKAFYPDESLPLEQRHNELRDRVFAAMKARADKESTYSIINYVLKGGSAKP
jgi:hypothetical protein